MLSTHVGRLLISSAIGALISTQAMAQSEPVAATPQASNETADAEQEGGLAEIVVTATRRPTSEMKTPISLAVVSGAMIEERNLTSLGDLSATVPSLQIGTGQPADAIFIRGIGSGSDRGFEQSVTLFLDGVYLPRSRQYRAAFLDVENVQVLRGPQALLYGLNATAGTIVVNSASTRPGDASFVNVLGQYETIYGRGTGQIVFGGSIGDDIGVRIAARYTDEPNGQYFNTTTGKKEGGEREGTIRGTLVYEPSTDLTFTAKLTYSDYDREGGLGECFNHPRAALSTVTVGKCDGVLDFRRQTGGLELLSQVTGNQDMYFKQNLLIGSATLEYRTGGHDITAVLGYSRTRSSSAFDVANIGVPLFSNSAVEKHDEYTGELRIASDDTARFSYLAGAFFGYQELHQEIPTATTLFLPAAKAFPGSDSTTTTISPYITGTFKFTDTVRISGGVRYSHDSKDATRFVTLCNRLIPSAGALTHTDGGPTANCGVSFPSQPGSYALPTFKSGNFMPEATLFWDFSPSSLVYLKAGQSVKSGGHTLGSSVASADLLAYGDEKARTFELGLKSRLFDNRLFFRASAFYSKYDDLQVNSFILAGGSVLAAITNAGASRSYGLETDIDFAPTNWLTLSWSNALLDSKYTDYENGACGVGQVPNTALRACRKTGQNTPFAPNYSGSVSANVKVPVRDNVEVFGGGTWAYSDSYFAENTLDPFVAQGAYSTFDARLGVGGVDGKWSLSVIGKNLSNERILGSSQSIGIQGLGHLKAPRTVTLQFTKNF